MEAENVVEAPLVVIVGPTASGKTALAIELAEQFDGEIICADSRTIYRGMDIGTAKPTDEDRRRVPHWGLDLIEPDQSYSAADFKRYAQAAIRDIRSRGHLPFLVGGTGLYIDAVVLDYEFGPAPDLARRAALEKYSLEELHEYCKNNNILLPENKANKRYVIRAIEQIGITTMRREVPIDNCIIVGITTDRSLLRQRMALRTEQLFEQGVVEEAKILGKKYGWDAPGMSGNIYRLIHSLSKGELDLASVRSKNTTLDWQLAKRQLTWLKRRPFIQWLSLSEAAEYIRLALAKSP